MRVDANRQAAIHKPTVSKYHKLVLRSVAGPGMTVIGDCSRTQKNVRNGAHALCVVVRRRTQSAIGFRRWSGLQLFFYEKNKAKKLDERLSKVRVENRERGREGVYQNDARCAFIQITGVSKCVYRIARSILELSLLGRLQLETRVHRKPLSVFFIVKS